MLRLILCVGMTTFLMGCGADPEQPTPSDQPPIEDSSQKPTAPQDAPTTAKRAAPAQVEPVLSELTQEDRMRDEAYTSQSKNNLKLLTLGLHNYLSTYGHFPPAVVLGPDDKPWHSWRVLILPFIDQVEMYNQYRLTEPWNSEHNFKIAETIIPTFNDPIHNDQKSTYTHYAAALGSDTILNTIKFDGTEAGLTKSLVDCTRLADIKDGTSNTILLGTINPAEKIVWSEPRDIDIDTKSFELSSPGSFFAPYQLSPTNVKGAALFGRGDGSVQLVPGNISPTVLKAQFTKSGQEALNPGN